MVDLKTKDLLNPSEAEELFGLSRRKFRKFLNAIESRGGAEFLAYYGKRRLIIRTEFERVLSKHQELRRCVRDGGKWKQA